MSCLLCSWSHGQQNNSATKGRYPQEEYTATHVLALHPAENTLCSHGMGGEHGAAHLAKLVHVLLLKLPNDCADLLELLWNSLWNLSSPHEMPHWPGWSRRRSSGADTTCGSSLSPPRCCCSWCTKCSEGTRSRVQLCSHPCRDSLEASLLK